MAYEIVNRLKDLNKKLVIITKRISTESATPETKKEITYKNQK